ncbi:uncharacterized protein AMSG_05807 [Thecamonas trahens ATCC 50062]|uniref:VWFA domain-containing protein n=1 Tax=Thecamonas trahens ATCC 50062 TaxID=461836 RepID=A0A0L0DD66_THETB|nr:hypothetical protein AMSG_05807 [Thecamonas trahens ATCC 50062]KNC50046.1 hypothetical protein AMSG_05807 [Thecamonas trahens ATCC 50062]|eukprot:XP_013757212.1 hypothetical protein AMSG_05807 [Thecamonas trahens ATCC 50062]
MTAQTLELFLHLHDAGGSLYDASRAEAVHSLEQPVPALPLSVVTPSPKFSVKFVKVWSNAGIATRDPFSVWRVALPRGHVRFGDTIVAGTSQPKFGILMAPDSPAFRHPRGYELVLRIQKGIKSLWIWRPIPPDPMFVALGYVATTTAFEPSVRVVHTAHAHVVTAIEVAAPPIWTDEFESEYSTVSLHRVSLTGLLTLNRRSLEAQYWGTHVMPPKVYTINENAVLHYISPEHNYVPGASSLAGMRRSVSMEATLVRPSGRRTRLPLERVYDTLAVYSLRVDLPSDEIGPALLEIKVDGVHIARSPFVVYVHDVSPVNTTLVLKDGETGEPVSWELADMDDFTGSPISDLLRTPQLVAGKLYQADVMLRAKDGRVPMLRYEAWCPLTLAIGPRVVVHSKKWHESSKVEILFTPLGNSPLERDFPVINVAFRGCPGQVSQYWARGEVFSFCVVDPGVHFGLIRVRELMASREQHLLDQIVALARQQAPRNPHVALAAAMEEGHTMVPSGLLRGRLKPELASSLGRTATELSAASLVDLFRMSDAIERPSPQMFNVTVASALASLGRTRRRNGPARDDDLYESNSSVSRLQGRALPVVQDEGNHLCATTLSVLPPALSVQRCGTQASRGDDIDTAWSVGNSAMASMDAALASWTQAQWMSQPLGRLPQSAVDSPTNSVVIKSEFLAVRRPSRASSTVSKMTGDDGRDDYRDGLFESVSASSIVTEQSLARPAMPATRSSQLMRKVFVLDVSESMQGLQTIRKSSSQKVQVRRAEMARADLLAELDKLPLDAQFEVLKFGNKVIPLFHGLQSVRSSRISRARKFVLSANTPDEINTLAPNSNMYLGLETAFVHPQYGNATHVVLYTDGEPELRAGGTSTPMCSYPVEVRALKEEIVAPSTKELFFNGRSVIVEIRLYAPQKASVPWMEEFIAGTSPESCVRVIGPIIENELHPPRDFANI